MRAQRLAQLALAVAAWAWVAAIVFVPGLVFPVGRFICHQRPERSFFFHGRQLAVCARCTGLYFGAAGVVPLAWLAAAQLQSGRARWLLILAALPTAVTWAIEFAGLAPVSNLVRCVAALPMGAAAAWLVFSVTAKPPASALVSRVE
ncbi:MAG TPA: DUF2085 domain-containing protein [Vicinamibacterales bacterium]|jgi:uncharacterized membrane protein